MKRLLLVLTSILLVFGFEARAQYCQPVYTTGTGFGDYVSLVQLGTINNVTTGAPSPYYTYYNTMSATLLQNGSYSITVRPGTYSFNDMVAWIDYNQDNVFQLVEKIGEIYNMGPSPATATFNFTVPGTALIGTTRLRVREADQGSTAMDPCATYTYGETEDYNIVIQAPPPIDMSVTTFTSPSQNAGCMSGNQTVTVTIRNNGSAIMDYSVTPVTISSSVTGPNPMTFTPVVLTSGTLAPNATQSVVITTTYNMTAFGTYTFNANTTVAGDGNTSNDAAPAYVVVNAALVSSASANPPAYCIGGSSQLSGCSPSVVTIGTGTVTNANTNYPAPYGNWYWGSRHQMLILASELTALGIGAGDISTLAFDVVSNNGQALIDFTISLGTTSLTSLTSFQSGLTQVFTTPSYMPVPGFNTHTFQTPFYWNGTSNIIVETCHQNTSYTYNAVMRHTVTGFTSTVYFYQDAPNTCITNVVYGTTTQRPNMRITGCKSGMTYSWTPSTNLSSTTIGNPVANPTTTTTYSVTVSSPGGCSSSASVTVTVNPLPTVTVVPANNTICNNTNTSITASGASTYTWSPATGLSATTGGTVTANPSVTTTYTITGTSAQGCTNTSTVTINVNNAPVVTLGSDITQCPGNITLDAGNPGNSYLWSTGATTQQEIVNATGAYSVIVTDGNGCNGYDTINILINPNPVVSLGADITQCAGTVLLDAGNPGANYLWSESSTTQQILVTTSGTYSVTVTDLNGCSNSDTINITINPLPVVALGNDTTRCGGTVTLDAGNPGSSYAWSESSTTQQITVSVSGTYSVVVTDLNGCTNADTIDVTINSIPVVALGPDVTQCGDSVMLDAGNPGSGYSWNTGATTQVIYATSSGVYAVTVTSPQGCTSSDAIIIIINPVPVVALGPDITQCGGTVVLDAQNPGAQYLWSTGATTQTITVSTNGTYNVIVTNNFGCMNSDTIDIIVNTPPDANAGLDTSICLGNSVMLISNGPFVAYSWTDGNFTSNTQFITVSPNVTTTYYLTVTDVAGCTDTDTIVVTVETIPTASFTTSIVNLNTVNFTNTSVTPPFSSVWNFGDGSPLNTQTNPTHIYANNGNYNVTLTVTNDCGSTSFFQTVVIAGLGFGEITELHGLSVFPNPTSGLLNLVIDNGNVDRFNVQITDVTGKLIREMNGNANGMNVNEQIDLSEISNGVYFMKVSAAGAQQTVRVVINR